MSIIFIAVKDMIALREVKKEIAAQKRVVSRLKREIFGADKTVRSRYIRDFNREFASYQRVCAVEEIVDAALSSDIVYFGDYHPLKDSQDSLLLLLEALKAKGAKVVLALEMLYEYQQETLDRWMQGTVNEETFLESIDYNSEWGFNWQSYRRIFQFAKDPFVPIFGIDSGPRDDLRFIRARDRMMARRIESIRNFFPGHIILVMIGESHLASNHLPAQVKRLCGAGTKDLVVVHNIDEIYWKLLLAGMEEAEAVEAGGGRYCLMTTSPIIKYQSYRDIFDQWTEGVECDILTPSLEEMAENILIFLLGRPEKLQVTVQGDWKEDVSSIFPEVHCRKTYNSFSSMLRSMKIKQSSILAAMESLQTSKIVYMPSINASLLMKFTPEAAAREAARFVVYAMRDEVGIRNRVRRGLEDRFYAFVFEEALSVLGAKIIIPKLDPVKSDPLLGCIDARGRVRKPLKGVSLAQTREIADHLRYHFRRERESSDGLRATKGLRDIWNLGIRKRLHIVRTLGTTLGEAIYKGYHEGAITRQELLGLFRERFDAKGEASDIYVRWVKRCSPARGGSFSNLFI